MSDGNRSDWQKRSNQVLSGQISDYENFRSDGPKINLDLLIDFIARLDCFLKRRLACAVLIPILLGLALPTGSGLASTSSLQGEVGQLAWLHTPPAGDRAPPVIIIVPDDQQQNTRHERYVEQLRSSGFAVIVPAGEMPRLGWLVTAARQSPLIDGDRIGLLSFGRGAAMALEFGRLPRALLYPGCSQLPFPLETGHLLLIHGDADPANPAFACAAMALGWAELGADVTHYVLQGVGYAWDSQPAYGLSQLDLRPLALAHGTEAHTNAAVTDQAADMVVQYFRGVLMWDGG